LCCKAHQDRHLLTASCTWMLRATTKGARAGCGAGGGGMMAGSSVHPRRLQRRELCDV
jgi:hypothetical protein